MIPMIPKADRKVISAPPTPSFFVTGTDTNIGKTVVSTLLSIGLGAHYWKPIQTGAVEGHDATFVRHFIGGERIGTSTYVFSEPLSPHLAAAREGIEIDMGRCFEDFMMKPRPLIIEGAGGVMVPINSSTLMVDLIRVFALPTIVVSSTKLGTINHTLLTLEALQRREIPIAGLITIGEERREEVHSIQRWSGVPRLGHLPMCSKFTYQWFEENFQSLTLFPREETHA